MTQRIRGPTVQCVKSAGMYTNSKTSKLNTLAASADGRGTRHKNVQSTAQTAVRTVTTLEHISSKSGEVGSAHINGASGLRQHGQMHGPAPTPDAATTAVEQCHLHPVSLCDRHKRLLRLIQRPVRRQSPCTHSLARDGKLLGVPSLNVPSIYEKKDAKKSDIFCLHKPLHGSLSRQPN